MVTSASSIKKGTIVGHDPQESLESPESTTPVPIVGSPAPILFFCFSSSLLSFAPF